MRSLTSGLVALTPLMGLAVCTAVLFGGAAENGWCCDDPQILKHAIQYGPTEYFFSPAAWRALIPYSFTPWLSLSYDLDFALFGFEPRGFHLHNLTVVALCAFLIYRLSRLWAGVPSAAGGALLFLAGAPVSTISQQLMTRHYMAGLLFYLLALLFIAKGVRTGRAGYGVAAGIAYFVAACCKEIYLPLGLLPLVLPVGAFRRRLVLSLPMLCVIALYVPWRWYMLGAAIGGYTPAGKFDFAMLAVSSAEFGRVPGLLWTHPLLALVALAALLAFGLSRKAGRWQTMLVLGCSLFALGLPLLPLVKFPGLGPGSERYFLAVWAATSVCVAVLAGRLGRVWQGWGQVLSLTIFLALAVPAWGKSSQILAGMASLQSEYRAQGRVLVTAGSGDTLFASAGVASWFLRGMRELRPAMGVAGAGPEIIVDESELIGFDAAQRRLWRYEPSDRAMHDITSSVPELLSSWRSRLRAVPLDVAVGYDRQTRALDWRLGPYEGGAYIFLAPVDRVIVPQQGALRMDKPIASCFRIRYDSPEGWIAYSGPLVFAGTGGEARLRVTWRGRGDLFDGLAHAPVCGQGERFW